MPTKKYLFIQRNVPGGKREQPSPAQMQQMYASFNAWKEKFADNIADMGGKLLPGGKVVTTAGVSDGPLVESKEIIGGFMIVAADTLDRAIAVARESPGLPGPGSSIEIREIAGP
ncbi:MAG: YciI family protein [Polyangiaceae bacterium]